MPPNAPPQFLLIVVGVAAGAPAWLAGLHAVAQRQGWRVALHLVPVAEGAAAAALPAIEAEAGRSRHTAIYLVAPASQASVRCAAVLRQALLAAACEMSVVSGQSAVAGPDDAPAVPDELLSLLRTLSPRPAPRRRAHWRWACPDCDDASCERHVLAALHGQRPPGA